jgi:hypothetical protein
MPKYRKGPEEATRNYARNSLQAFRCVGSVIGGIGCIVGFFPRVWPGRSCSMNGQDSAGLFGEDITRFGKG